MIILSVFIHYTAQSTRSNNELIATRVNKYLKTPGPFLLIHQHGLNSETPVHKQKACEATDIHMEKFESRNSRKK
jgi:hypothetical protein